jgi:hypothetical protein
LQFSLVLQYYAKWSLQYKLVVIVFPVQRMPNLPQFCVFVLGLVLGLSPCLQHIYGHGMGKVDCAGELKEHQKPYSCQIGMV